MNFFVRNRKLFKSSNLTVRFARKENWLLIRLNKVIPQKLFASWNIMILNIVLTAYVKSRSAYPRRARLADRSVGYDRKRERCLRAVASHPRTCNKKTKDLWVTGHYSWARKLVLSSMPSLINLRQFSIRPSRCIAPNENMSWNLRDKLYFVLCHLKRRLHILPWNQISKNFLLLFPLDNIQVIFERVSRSCQVKNEIF